MKEKLHDEYYSIFSTSQNEDIYDSKLYEFVKDYIVNDKSNIPPLFRYSSADYFNVRNLEKEQLVLMQLSKMNDAFEGLTYKLEDDSDLKIDVVSESIYIKSFCENKNDLLMWAYYADNYKGMCVEYDFSKLEEDVLWHLFPVCYLDEKQNKKYVKYFIEDLIQIKKEDENMESLTEKDWLKDMMSLFLQKSKRWKREREWRILSTYYQIKHCADDIDDNECKKFYDMNEVVFSVKNCIKKVYLGLKMEEVFKEHIVEICNKLNIPVYETKIDKNKYILKEKKIKKY